jgi:hypothetical protein
MFHVEHSTNFRVRQDVPLPICMVREIVPYKKVGIQSHDPLLTERVYKYDMSVFSLLHRRINYMV